jgi:PilZ domain
MTEVAIASTASAPAEKRRSRQSRLLRAHITSRRLGRFTATVRNVSEQGIGGKAPHELNLGERVQVDLPGLLPLVGTVRWTFEGQFGIETDKAIALDALRNAHGNALPTANDSVQFAVMRPPVVSARRPGLGTVSAPFGQATPTEWQR